MEIELVMAGGLVASTDQCDTDHVLTTHWPAARR